MQDLTYKIECTVIATMLFNESYLDEKPFKIESRYFTHFFNKIACDKIIGYLNDNKSLLSLDIRIDAWVRDKKPEFQQFYINIIASTPLTMKVAERYYEELKINYTERLLNGN